MRKIDAHLHVNFRDIDHSSLIRYLDKASIDKCWLHTWEEVNPAIPDLYKGFPPEEVFLAFDKYPGRIIPFYAPDPSSGNIRQKLEKYIARGLRGCGELKVSLSWGEIIVKEYLDILQVLKLPLMFHMESPRLVYNADRGSLADRAFALLANGAFNGVTGYYIRKLSGFIRPVKNFLDKKSVLFPGYLCDFSLLERRLAEYPGIVFIAHGPGFWNNISAIQSDKYFYQKGKNYSFGIIDSILENYPNLYCDISGKGAFIALTRNRRQSAHFLKKHSAKILFGTDNTDSHRLESVIFSAGLTRPEMENIFYNNALKITG